MCYLRNGPNSLIVVPLVFAPANRKKLVTATAPRGPHYGLQTLAIASSGVFVLPSTSGAARGYWNPQYWQELAEFVRRYRSERTELQRGDRAESLFD